MERPNNIPICSACFDFTPDGNKFEKFTIVVAPIVSSHLGDGIWKTAWACSRGKFCKNRECIYSKGSNRNDESEGDSPFYSVGNR
ncbi:hypothetical protein MUP77_21705 [Candidatus Bathyarchaeota archaeon]|nr:hypothetical protein [Candidatus Bathyarchaeota archaeon]